MIIRKKIAFGLLVLGAILVASCKNSNVSYKAEKQEDDKQDELEADSLQLFEEVVLPRAVDELFDDFFFNFVGDQRFQMQRIDFPLTFTDADNSTVQISSDDWDNYNNFAQQEVFSVIYDRNSDLDLPRDTSITSVGVEWLYLRAGYCERYNFKKVDGKWMLCDLVQKDFDNVPNGDFLHFYRQFVADSAYQRSNLSPNLQFASTDETEDIGEEEFDGTLSADEWFEFKQEMPFSDDVLVNIDYGQSVGSKRSKNMMMTGMSNGLLITFKFKKEEDNWVLYEIEN